MMEKQELIPLEEARRQVALVCRRLGLLHLAFAEVLVAEMGQEKGEKIVARAIKEYSQKIGEIKRDAALGQGLELNAESFSQVSDIPSVGMHERTEQVEVEGEKRDRLYGCVIGKVWQEYGKNRLGRIYCYVDPASSMAFNPQFKMVHTKALPDGDKFCELVFRPTTKKDRQEFDRKDTDWAFIETNTSGE